MIATDGSCRFTLSATGGCILTTATRHGLAARRYRVQRIEHEVAARAGTAALGVDRDRVSARLVNRRLRPSLRTSTLHGC